MPIRSVLTPLPIMEPSKVVYVFTPSCAVGVLFLDDSICILGVLFFVRGGGIEIVIFFFFFFLLHRFSWENKFTLHLLHIL